MNQLTIILSSLFLFLAIAILMSFQYLVGIDHAIIHLLSERSSDTIHAFFSIISKVGSSEMILLTTVVIGIIFLLKRNWYHFFLFAFLSGGGVVLNFVIKIIFQRERPGEMSSIEVFGYAVDIQSYSFPSGHTMRAVILFLFLIYLCYKFIRSSSLKVVTIVFLIALITAIAVSRIVVGAHFPSDVLGAIFISITWFYTSLALAQLIKKKYEKKRQAI